MCREYEIAGALYYLWRNRLLEGGKAALANPRERSAEHTEIAELKRKVGQLERALGRKTWSAGEDEGLDGVDEAVRSMRSRVPSRMS